MKKKDQLLRGRPLKSAGQSKNRLVTYFSVLEPARFTSILCNNYTVAEGDDVRIEVEAAGVPNNLTFKWFYEGIPISMYKR